MQRGGILFRSIDRARADVIVAADGKAVRTLDDLLTVIESKRPGDRVEFSLLRDGKRQEVTVELETARN